jgi:hypothetical protein
MIICTDAAGDEKEETRYALPKQRVFILLCYQSPNQECLL